MKKGTSIIVAALTLLALSSLYSCETFPTYDESPALLFQTGFAGTSVASSGTQTATFSGTDPDYTELSAWAGLEGGDRIDAFFINYEAGTASQRFAAIAVDPEDALNPVVQFRINEPHIYEGAAMKGRVSAIMEGLKGVYGFSQTIRLRLDPSLSVLGAWDKKIDWLTLFEFWCGQDDRLTVSLYKDAGAGQPIRWRFTKDHMGWFGWIRDWEAVAAGHDIAFGTWMKIGLAAKVGEEGKAGAWLGIEEGGSWTTVLESTKAIGKPSGFTKLNPMKLYTSDHLIDYVSGSGATLEVLWDDWRLWLNDGIVR